MLFFSGGGWQQLGDEFSKGIGLGVFWEMVRGCSFVFCFGLLVTCLVIIDVFISLSFR